MGSSAEAVFVPADPPRTGVIAVWGDPHAQTDGEVEIVRLRGAQVRRTVVPARILPIADAVATLSQAPAADATRSYRGWSTAMLAGLGLVARGRVVPARTAGGFAGWRVGPLDRADRIWLRDLAAALSPEAYAVPTGTARPVRLPAPEQLVRAFWDAIADTMIRTRAAELSAGAAPFAAIAPTRLEGVAGWLGELDRAEEAGATVVVRVQPPPDEADVEAGGAPSPDGNRDPLAADDELRGFRGTLHLRSVVDPSLLVDVADLWSAPATVLARLGDQAETDLLVGLRRGARAWPPLGRTLRAATADALDLEPAELEDLLVDGSEALDNVGIEVQWPAELFGGGLEVRASVHRPAAPAGAQPPRFSLHDLLEFQWRPTLDGEPLTADEIATITNAKRQLVRLRGRWVRMDRTVLERLRRRTRRRLTTAEALAAALTGQLEVDGEPVEFVADQSLADLAARLRTGADGPRELPEPPDLHAVLRPYQRRGLAWLAQIAELGIGGCLADDMGLGKTLQLIALHLHRRPYASGPTLVICPTTLLGTWHREIARFAPTISVRRFHGAARTLADVAADDLVLTTYGVVRQDHERLAEIGWGLVVADEAQHAKNPRSRTARAIRAVPSAVRIALTGTPVENRLSELWAILDWTTPGLLGPLETFRRTFAVPVERYRDEAATARLGGLTRPFLLRRRKIDPGIAPELPAKTESDVVVGLTSEQATLYQAVVDETMAKIAASEGIARRGLVLSLLTSLKQICNHPAQYLHEPGPLAGRSAKLAAVEELLSIIGDEGESALVFTQYVEMGRLLEDHLAGRGVQTLFLHGGVSATRRDRMVADFQAGAVSVFLLSLKAGGVGLTLTRATHVIHFDRWWNPAVEDQATDRAYRIGQDRPVQVHRLVTEGTLEDRIARLIESKRALAEAVIGSGETWLTELSDAALADLVRLGEDGAP